MNFKVNSVDELDSAAAKLLYNFPDQKKFAVYGEMGAGKTTFIKAICKYLGVNENTSSPTFAIINEYKAKEKIYHLDLFRIKSVHELTNIGIEEYFEKDNYIFVEWPQIIEPLLEDYGFMKIIITVKNNNHYIQRTIHISR